MNEINGNKMLNNIYEEKTKETDVAVTEQKEITSLPETSSPPKKQKKRFLFLPMIAAAAVLVIGFLVFMIFRTEDHENEKSYNKHGGSRDHGKKEKTFLLFFWR